jgi:FemAB family protein
VQSDDKQRQDILFESGSVIAMNTAVKSFREARSDWDYVIARANDAPAGYESLAVDYYNSYLAASNDTIEDCSIVIYCDGRAAAVWPIQFVLKEGSPLRATTNGSSIGAPCFSNEISDKNQKKIRRQCLAILNNWCLERKTEFWETCDDAKELGISEWQKVINHISERSMAGVQLYVDTEEGLEEIRAKFRKSNKNNLNVAAKTWQTEIYHKCDTSSFGEFFELHKEVSGRLTRSLETWELQRRALIAGKAYLVVLRESTGRMVGAGYFMVSKSESYYGVAAFRRELFEQPLGHLVVWEGLKFAKSLGIRWFNIGNRCYEHLDPEATPKQLAIADFKEGFATRFFVRINSQIKVATN